MTMTIPPKKEAASWSVIIIFGGFPARLAALSLDWAPALRSARHNWPEMLRELLGILEPELILRVIAIGYPGLVTVPPSPRPLVDITSWHGFKPKR
ncbi:hypothetical protein ACFLUO_04120 [Chloroflexota bacterium]